MKLEVTIPKSMIRELEMLRGGVNESEVDLAGLHKPGGLRFLGFRGRHIGNQLYGGVLCFEATEPSEADTPIAFGKLLGLIGGQ